MQATILTKSKQHQPQNAGCTATSVQFGCMKSLVLSHPTRGAAVGGGAMPKLNVQLFLRINVTSQHMNKHCSLQARNS